MLYTAIYKHKYFTMRGFANHTTFHSTTQTLFPNVLAALFNRMVGIEGGYPIKSRILWGKIAASSCFKLKYLFVKL
jgi:hypothetical protein